MKNIYKDFIKIMDKADNLHVGKRDNKYYICDGYQAIWIEEFVYKFWFMTEKPYYIALEEGQGYTLPKKKNQMIDNITEALHVDRMFNFNNTVTVWDTGYLRESSNDKDKDYIRIIKSDNTLIAVNNTWYKSLCNAGFTAWAGSERHKPILSEHDGNYAILLPVRSNEMLDELQNIVSFNSDIAKVA